MNTEKIPEYIDIGYGDKDWYAETENLFVEIYGRHKLVTVANMFAATSINSSLKSNIRLFRRAWHELEHNLPHEKYLPNIRDQLNALRNGGELSGNKIRSFARAMSGGKNSVVVDIWLLRAFDEDRKYSRHTGPHAGKERSGGATEKQYRMIEEWVRNRAMELGLEPRQLSSIIWSGVRTKATGKQNTTKYHDILRHQLFNMYDRKTD
jgi:hypothetical protein